MLSETFTRATFCDSNHCLEAAYRRSSRCDNAACLEAAHRGGRVLVRDSKWMGGPELAFTPQDWTAFVAGLPERAR